MEMVTKLARFALYGSGTYRVTQKPTVGSWAWGMAQNILRKRAGWNAVSAPTVVDFLRHYVEEWAVEAFNLDTQEALTDGWPVELFRVLDGMVQARGGNATLSDGMSVPCFKLNRKSALVLPNMYIAYIDFENDGCVLDKLIKAEESMEDAIARKLGNQVNLRVLSRPARIEIDRTDAPTIWLASLWQNYLSGKIKPGRYMIGVESRADGQVIHSGSLADPNAFSLAAFGASGSGKTQTILSAMLTAAACTSPAELSIICIDPKAIDFQVDGLPHLACDVITDAVEAKDAIIKIVAEMDRRVAKKDSAAQNRRILIVGDELGDLLQVQEGDELEKALVRIGQKGRAWGISMFWGSQRGVNLFFPRSIHTQIPLYWVGAVASKQEAGFASGADDCDAHKLPGKGAAMVYERGKYVRVQSTFVADSRNKDYRAKVQKFVKDVGAKWDGVQSHYRLGQASEVDDIDAADQIDFDLVNALGDDLLAKLDFAYSTDPTLFNQSMFRRIYYDHNGSRMNTTKEARVYASYVAMHGVDA
ncbi:MAG TPA: FtsK/SpoIIIE domain-containing protein [Pseudomonadales bacterium]|nr:FtsK/SpoIIIE domain-containing protein [Pseudomonadales bacterium]